MRTHQPQTDTADRTLSPAQRATDTTTLENHSPQAAQLRATQADLQADTPAPIQKMENRTGMPDQLKGNLESMSGFDMSDVRVHYNSAKPAQLQAHAYAQGTDIHIAPGQERHLPHEAWHVVQQKQGRVKPTMQLKGVGVNDDVGLEREADVMGGEVKKIQPMLTEKKSSFSESVTPILQYMKWSERVLNTREKMGKLRKFVKTLPENGKNKDILISVIKILIKPKMPQIQRDLIKKKKTFTWTDLKKCLESEPEFLEEELDKFFNAEKESNKFLNAEKDVKTNIYFTHQFAFAGSSGGSKPEIKTSKLTVVQYEDKKLKQGIQSYLSRVKNAAFPNVIFTIKYNKYQNSKDCDKEDIEKNIREILKKDNIDTSIISISTKIKEEKLAQQTRKTKKWKFGDEESKQISEAENAVQSEDIKKKKEKIKELESKIEEDNDISKIKNNIKNFRIELDLLGRSADGKANVRKDKISESINNLEKKIEDMPMVKEHNRLKRSKEIVHINELVEKMESSDSLIIKLSRDVIDMEELNIPKLMSIHKKIGTFMSDTNDRDQVSYGELRSKEVRHLFDTKHISKPQEIEHKLENVIKMYNSTRSQVKALSEKDVIDKASSVFLDIRKIQPFPDANGRIGRVLMYALLQIGGFERFNLNIEKFNAITNTSIETENQNLTKNFISSQIFDERKEIESMVDTFLSEIYSLAGGESESFEITENTAGG